jgi:DHA1 family tetracycline resistance protein-like MFS transporter
VLLIAIVVEAPWGLAGPAMQGLMSRQVDGSAQGQLQGALGSLRGITGMIGPLLFTQVLAGSLRGAPVLSGLGAGAPFYIASVLLVATALVAAAATRTRPG